MAFLAATAVVTPVRDKERCIPPVSSKPQIEYASGLGTMTITPQVSEAEKDNTITISVTPRADARLITLARPIESKKGGTSTFGRGELLDWGPKRLPEGASFRFVEFDGIFRWEAHDLSIGWFRTKRVRLPAGQKYWVKITGAYKTVSDESDQNVGPYGWRAVDYYIQNDKETKSGRGAYYVGGVQRPVLRFEKVGPYADDFWKERLVTVKAGEPFDIQMKATGQGGTARVKTVGPRIVGSNTVSLKSGEIATWKIMPRGSYPVEIETSIENNCGSSYNQKLRVPVKFDFAGLTEEKVRLVTGAFSVFPFEKLNASLPLDLYLQVMDQGMVVVGVPNRELTLEVLYKNTNEIVKSFIVSPSKIITDKDGKARVTLAAPKLTKEDASRGLMMLRLTAESIPGAVFETRLPLTGVSVDITPKRVESIPDPVTTKKADVTIVDMRITVDKSLDSIKEGEVLKFKTTLFYSDGSTGETKGVKWAVAGPVGSISADGTFTSKLDDEVAEYGEGQGAVVAGYVDAGGKIWGAESPSFKVEARTEDVDDTRG